MTRVVGLIPNVRATRRRADISDNLDHLETLIAAYFACQRGAPSAELVVIPEGALQGFQDEQLDTPHAEYWERSAIDLPGPEFDRLASLARRFGVIIAATAKARSELWPGRYFNTAFLISSGGDLVLRHHKLNPILPTERSMSPHDVWSEWVQRFGDDPGTLFPVAKTPIGAIGFMHGHDGSFPEVARGLAQNGCEIAIRGPFAPVADAMVQNRARALDQTMFVVGNQLGHIFPDRLSPRPLRFPFESSIVDFTGAALAYLKQAEGATWIAATLDLDALRRARASARPTNFGADLRAELYRGIYRKPALAADTALTEAPLSRSAWLRAMGREDE